MNLTKSIHIKALFTTAFGLLLLSSCVRDEQSPGYEYMPDMYRSPAIEAYVDYGEIRDTIRPELNLTMSARQPVEGTVPMSEYAMNDMPYSIPNTPEGYELAGEVLKSPYPQSQKIILEGTEVYANFCVQCHGAKGKGDGAVVIKGGHPAPPAYDGTLKDLSEGKMFHTITYGKGLMGSHASQISKSDRWKVIAFVKTLQNPDAQVTEQNGSEADTTGTAEMPN
ncbi:cytochrome c [Cryomorpha ignava]|uniref:Cytochrome c n=1 Tax=Cryomorpha ignava TaxID=101383 RepID=A0A7K3WJS8_9FLAO|nr:cytochrome c [Cryomorpha ignava]NEN21897.1 cytochrome c [Cryomorpha ignava]